MPPAAMPASSGKPGVCVATSGPGATNLITGTAPPPIWTPSPSIAITGQVRSDLLGRDVFQEADITGACEPFTKAFLPGEKRGGPAPGFQGGVPHRRYRASRSGADRHSHRIFSKTKTGEFPLSRQGGYHRLQAPLQRASPADQAGVAGGSRKASGPLICSRRRRVFPLEPS